MVSAFALPAVLFGIGLGLAAGGVYALLALGLVVALSVFADSLQVETEGRRDGGPRWLLEAPLVLTPIAIAFATLVVVMRVSGAGGWAPYDWGDTVVAIVVLGVVYGAAAPVVGHELIHRIDRPGWIALGQFLQAFPLDTSDTVEHVYGHHATVATFDDPTTARRGEGLWAYLPRAIVGALASAWRLERDRLAVSGRGVWSANNLVLQGFAIQTALLASCALIGGWNGFLAVLIAGLFGRLLVEVSKYASHYGLVRVPGMPIEPRHSWNGAGAIVTDMMLRASFHSDHHVHPERGYWDLVRRPDGPLHPYSAGLMTLLSFVPPLWIPSMAPRLAAWDAHAASEAERTLLATCSPLNEATQRLAA